MAEPQDIDVFMRDYRARTQIHDALMRSCRGVDRLDRELILSAYHPAAHDNHGSFAGPVEDFVDWVFGNHQGKIQSCVHHLGNVLMRIDPLLAEHTFCGSDDARLQFKSDLFFTPEHWLKVCGNTSGVDSGRKPAASMGTYNV